MVGDELEFQKIYADYRPRVLRYLTGLVGAFEAEDLTQEVFLRIHQALPAFRGESRISTWIYRIATNAAYDRMRQSSYRNEASQELLVGADELEDSEPGEQAEQGAYNGEAALSVEQYLHRKQRLDCFCDFIENLPENYRLVVALNTLESFTAREIAEILGLSLDVVKIRLHRGRAKLLEELKARCKPEDWL